MCVCSNCSNALRSLSLSLSLPLTLSRVFFPQTKKQKKKKIQKNTTRHNLVFRSIPQVTPPLPLPSTTKPASPLMSLTPGRPPPPFPFFSYDSFRFCFGQFFSCLSSSSLKLSPQKKPCINFSLVYSPRHNPVILPSFLPLSFFLLSFFPPIVSFSLRKKAVG